jgi:hypothetical protein
MAHPRTMIGSDGLPHERHPHPRLWGAFPLRPAGQRERWSRRGLRQRRLRVHRGRARARARRAHAGAGHGMSRGQVARCHRPRRCRDRKDWVCQLLTDTVELRVSPAPAEPPPSSLCAGRSVTPWCGRSGTGRLGHDAGNGVDPWVRWGSPKLPRPRRRRRNHSGASNMDRHRSARLAATRADTRKQVSTRASGLTAECGS